MRIGIGLGSLSVFLRSVSAAVAAIFGIRQTTAFPAGRADGTERIESSLTVVNT